VQLPVPAGRARAAALALTLRPPGSGPAPAEQCNPDDIDSQHNVFSLGDLSGDEASEPEGADVAAASFHPKVMPAASCRVLRRTLGG
jgi:hypothetical protein